MVLKLYNTIIRTIEIFKPIKERKVNMFVCGPTVYNYAHIGNLKTFTQFDMLAKYLRYKGFNVFYLQNITDIDDRIIKRAKEEKVKPEEIAKKYEKIFYEHIKLLGIDSINEFARASDHIKEIIEQIQRLIDKGYAYETDDGVYFEVKKFKDYGKLSHQPLEQIKEGARVEVNENKKNPEDFALWKKYKSGEPFWESPFGKGRPGWHIEDTAITEHYFGPQYDLHGGAIDLIFPHHEAEIAQQEASSGKEPLVKYWVHTAFLNVGDEKMSKSLGNYITLPQLLEKGYKPKTIRYLFLSVNYRQPMNFSFESLEYAQNAVDRINTFYNDLGEKKSKKDNTKIQKLINLMLGKFEEAMDFDLNISVALSEIFIFIRKVNKLELSEKDVKDVRNAFKKLDAILCILEEQFIKSPKYIEDLIEEREDARKLKDFEKADAIRKTIEEKGYILEDLDGKVRVKKK
ncbi:cysteine--tRNA ligase [Candidatus Woesearchaeota archaeon]|nr:cysteine--tRNA ligase [Candidatus Woesearchaeota archaeon]